MKTKVLIYRGKEISVHYDVVRCIHAAECVHGLPQVFDPKRKPWVSPDQATPEEVLHGVSACPTGALSVRGVTAAENKENTTNIQPNGPLYAAGDIEIKTPDGELLLNDTRIALCRCGASQNKPLCDGAHAKAGFADAGALNNTGAAPVKRERGKLTFMPLPGGPLLFEGPCELTGANGGRAYPEKGALCRCGASQNKPFCDGSHSSIGFSGE
jgi:CDGSH-type Zn-finger protein/uncharacterized Fe-S cluster protein YjdI